MTDIMVGSFLSLAYAALAAYYYYVARSGVSKLFVIAVLISVIRNITSNFIHPDNINIVFYLFHLLQIILSLLLVFAFFRLYRDSIIDNKDKKAAGSAELFKVK